MKYRHLIITLLIALVIGACSSTPAVDDGAPEVATPEVVHLRLLAFNDFHGALEGPSGSVMVDGESVEAGGAAILAAHLDAERGEAHYTTVVAAGDLIGATPLISALFHDEPTIEIMNTIGLDVASVGNHEFDQGVDELLRIAHGGCHPEEGCREDHDYTGADFPYLAANVRFRDTGETIFPPYLIREYAGLQIAYVGMTLENTPQVVVPSAVETVTFHNEVETVQALMPELEEQGVDAIFVVVHEGAYPGDGSTDIGDCNDVTGPQVDLARAMSEDIPVIVGGHSHLAYICDIDGTLITQASSSGRVVTVIDIHIDTATGEIVEKSARQRATTHDLEPHLEVSTMVDSYAALADVRANRVVGQITEELPRGPRRTAGESPIGRLIADAQLAATAEEAGAQIAFMNPGGIRAALSFETEGREEPGQVTYAQLHTIQPFNNVLITMSLTGEQIHRLLEQQWREDATHHLAISQGFSYVYDPEAPFGERVDPTTIKLHGEVIDAGETYRVTVNNFMADGGDGFAVLKEGTDRTRGIIDLDALASYVEANSPLEPITEERARPVE